MVRDTVILHPGQKADATAARLASIAGLEPVATAVVPVTVLEGDSLSAVPSPFQVLPREAAILSMLTAINAALAEERGAAATAAPGTEALHTLSWLTAIQDMAAAHGSAAEGEEEVEVDEEEEATSSSDGEALPDGGLFGDDEDW